MKWKGGRVVECAGLEIRYTVTPYPGFKSLPFRQRIKHLCLVEKKFKASKMGAFSLTVPRIVIKVPQTLLISFVLLPSSIAIGLKAFGSVLSSPAKTQRRRLISTQPEKHSLSRMPVLVLLPTCWLRVRAQVITVPSFRQE